MDKFREGIPEFLGFVLEQAVTEDDAKADPRAWLRRHDRLEWEESRVVVMQFELRHGEVPNYLHLRLRELVQ